MGHARDVRIALSSALVACAVVSLSAPIVSSQSARRAEVHVVFASGERELAAARERVDVAAPALPRCDRAARALRGEPRLTVRLEIDARGRVEVAHALPEASHGAGSGPWERCVTSELSQLRFARGGRGVVDVLVVWRFVNPEDSPGVSTPPLPIVAYPSQRHGSPWGGPRTTRARPVAEVLERDEIRRIVRENLAPVRRCYERETVARPELAGRLNVRFVIDPDGTVSAVDAIDDELGSATLSTCVRYHVRLWRFPAHAGPPLVVEYPFVFRRD